MAYGLRHRTSRRWWTEKGTESPLEGRAREFPDFDAGEDFRKAGIGEFAGAWETVPVHAIRDHEGNVVQCAAAWNLVEKYQHALNAAAEPIPRLAVAIGKLQQQRLSWTNHGIPWTLVEAAQLELNAGAREIPSLESAVADLDAALKEYRRIAPNPQVTGVRAPGVGGLA